MKKRRKIDLHPRPKSTSQINRSLIITVSLVAGFLLLLALISAFDSPKLNDKKKTDELFYANKDAVDHGVTNPTLQELPDSYEDVEGINKFITSKNIGNNPQLNALLSELEEMRREYQSLKRQLATNSDAKPPVKLDSPKLQQAKNSGLVFAGFSGAIDTLIGAGADAKGAKSTVADALIATPQQEELFRKEAENAQRLAVMKGKDRPEDIYDLHNIVKPVSKYQIQAGTLIPATLITAIDTTLMGTVIAQVRSDLYDTVTGKYLLIPRGSKLLGEYDSRVTTGQRRVLLYFNRIIRPDGSSILLGKTLGADALGQSGLEGEVDNHWGRVLGAATISTILSVGAGIAADAAPDHNEYRRSTYQRAMLGGASGVNQVGQSIANRALDIRPTIKLNVGHQFHVPVRRDMVLTPYYK